MNYKRLKDTEVENSSVLLNCLLASFPENALAIYNTCDYWICKELLEINNNGKINQEEHLQNIENSVFNSYLNTYSNHKFNWLDIDEKKNLWQIREFSKLSLNT